MRNRTQNHAFFFLLYLHIHSNYDWSEILNKKIMQSSYGQNKVRLALWMFAAVTPNIAIVVHLFCVRKIPFRFIY